MSAPFRDPFDASAPLGNGCSCGRHASEHEHDRAQHFDPKGDRVKIAMPGRFLPYKRH